MAGRLTVFLVDTNIWLERLLNQERAPEVASFLASVPPEKLWITDFTLHSLGIILTRLRKPHVIRLLIQDLFTEGGVRLVSLNPQEMEKVVSTIERYGLDFDDAYQYTVAMVYDLLIVSFDEDFDRTERGRKTPGDVVQGKV